MPPLFAPRRAAAASNVRGDLDVPAPKPAGESLAFQRGREAAALLLFVAGVFTTLALLSFRANADPAEDWVGPVGASWAQALVGAIGVTSWAVPAELFLLVWPLLREKPSVASALRLSGDFLVVLVASAMVHVAFPETQAFGGMHAAGAVGELFGELMRSLFSTAGSFLIGFTVIGLILIGRASFSFIRFARRATEGTGIAAIKAASGARAVADAWERAAELRRQREEELAKNAQPVIHDAPAEGGAIVAALAEDETPDNAPKVLHVERDVVEEAPKKKRARKKKEKAEAVEEEPEPEPVDEHEAVEEDREEDEATEEDEAPEIAMERFVEPPAKSKREKKQKDDEPEGGPKIVDHVEKAVAETKEAKVTPEKKVETIDGNVFELPPPSLLEPPPASINREDQASLLARAKELERVLANYKVSGTVADIHTGPTVSTFEVVPAEGTKVSKVANLADDLALGLSCKVRIIAPIPGKSRIGFELPNKERIPVNLRELIEDRRFQEMNAPLPTVLGRDIVGAPFYADLASMPHVIVAGATGAGKSVGINVMLVSLLMRRTPEQLRLLMIDPKVVELAPFDKIPHLLLPVVTDMKQAANALKWAVDEMERRYQLFASAGTKNISTYNAWVERARRGEVKGYEPLKTSTMTLEDGTVVEAGSEREAPVLPEPLPFIVIVVDEFADLMMQQGKDVEASVARLAQKARAAGMHVVLATQRPSVDVITGMIKANFPTRIAFRVAQRTDSRTILDEQGAEHLLGRGDMLARMNGTNDTRRVQCPFVSEEEVQRVTDFLREQGEPVYDENILKPRDEDGDGDGGGEEDAELDPKYDEAVQIVASTRRCSTSWLQRKLGLGYNRAAKIVEAMEKRGIVGPANGAKDREVLIGPL